MAQTDNEHGDIVVTALKRETRVQDTPLAITALGGATLNAMGAASVADVARSVPSLNLLASDPGAPASRSAASRPLAKPPWASISAKCR
jgi:outer membrane receptor protein involved in Fe transport